MNQPDINIFLIAKTETDIAATRRWLDSLGALETDAMAPSGMSDGEHLIGLAAKRCYKSYEVGLNPNITKVRKVWSDYFDNILKSGHGSVLEHANYTFALENVTRVFTAEMNRHRAGVAISEQSLRYVRFDNLPFWMPPSLRPLLEMTDKKVDWDHEELKAKTRTLISSVLLFIEDTYKDLVRIWGIDGMTDFKQKKVVTSMLRRIIPLGVCTGAVYTLNGRAIRYILTMRASPEAEEEICHVFSRIGKIMLEEAPLLCGDFEETTEGFWIPKYRKV